MHTIVKHSLALAGVAGIIALIAASSQISVANAQSYSRTAIWVYVRAQEGENAWETCRRVFGRDVYRVRNGGGPKEARCYVNSSRSSDPRGRNRSFYR